MLTAKHLSEMRHAVGFFSERPDYRNMFNTDTSDVTWRYLKERGFADCRPAVPDAESVTYWVTDAGKELIGLPGQQAHMEQLARQHRRSIEELCEMHDISLG